MFGRLRFNEIWVKWIKGCLMSTRVSIFVNGSPMLEFMVSKGLRQGDPLDPFLFNVVVEGLCGLMRKALDKKLDSSFNVGNKGVKINILQ